MPISTARRSRPTESRVSGSGYSFNNRKGVDGATSVGAESDAANPGGAEALIVPRIGSATGWFLSDPGEAGDRDRGGRR